MVCEWMLKCTLTRKVTSSGKRENAFYPSSALCLQLRMAVFTWPHLFRSFNCPWRNWGTSQSLVYYPTLYCSYPVCFVGQVTTLAGGSQGYKDGKGEEAKFHHTAGKETGHLNTSWNSVRKTAQFLTLKLHLAREQEKQMAWIFLFL